MASQDLVARLGGGDVHVGARVREQEESEDARAGKRPGKLRSGQPASGVEGHPGTGHPLDPEPGLGGTLSLGLLEGKASPFFHIFPEP